VVPLWATEWQQANEGIYLTLNPKARWQDGTPATAEDLKANIEALMGKYAPDFKGTPRIGQFKRVVQEVQVIDPHQVLIKTEMPDPSFFSLVSGANYHQVWFGPGEYLQPTAFGGGPGGQSVCHCQPVDADLLGWVIADPVLRGVSGMALKRRRH
jgi:ABC-type transport system substrate-binding protein